MKGKTMLKKCIKCRSDEVQVLVKKRFINWNFASPVFLRQLLAIIFCVFVNMTGTIHAAQSLSSAEQWEVKSTWRTGTTGGEYYTHYPYEMIAGDIDDDGKAEIIGNGFVPHLSSLIDDIGASFLYVLKRIEGQNDFSVTWLSNSHPHTITALAAQYSDGQKISRIVAGMTDGSIAVYTVNPIKIIYYSQSTNFPVTKIIFGDADNDGKTEIVVADSVSIRFFDSSNFANKTTIPYGGADIELGNVDSDVLNELVLNKGLVFEFKGTSYRFDWNYIREGFRREIELADVDADGKDEILATGLTQGAPPITCFDADSFSEKKDYTLPVGNHLRFCDVDKDGIKELIYLLNGKIHCLNLPSISDERIIPGKESDVRTLCTGDFDNDSTMEIVDYRFNSNGNSINIWKLSEEFAESSGSSLSNPKWTASIGVIPKNFVLYDKIDKNSSPQLLVTGDAGLWSIVIKNDVPILSQIIRRVCSTNPATCPSHNIIQSSALIFNSVSANRTIIAISDSRITLLNSDSMAIKSTIAPTEDLRDSYMDFSWYDLQLADIDKDGDVEIVTCGQGDRAQIYPRIHVYNLSSKELEWKSPDLSVTSGKRLDCVRIGNIDADSSQEIVASNGNIFVFDGVSKAKKSQISNNTYLGIDLADIDATGVLDIIAGTESGMIVRFNGKTFSTKYEVQISEKPVVGVKAYDFDKDGKLEIVFASDGRLGIYDMDDSAVVWRSDTLSYIVGAQSKIIAGDFNGNDKGEIIVNTFHMVCAFEIEKSGKTSAKKSLGAGCTQAAKIQRPRLINTLFNPEIFAHGAGKIEIFNLQGKHIAGSEFNQSRLKRNALFLIR
jgi:hypothetical protein